MWARKYVGWNMAEQDDLVQEGMIAVWLALEAEVNPSKEVIQGRMIDYVRALGRQMGQGEFLSHVPIEFAQQELDDAAYNTWLDVEQG
jgi:DNA-directed RNA polymerase specialized sigma24 family protein